MLAAAARGLDERGFGLSSVRFICGTQDIHRELERRIAAFLGTEDTILYSSCFDANGGLFETILGAEDAIVSDELTTPASSTACASAAPSGTATGTGTWTTWRPNSTSAPERAAS